MSAVRILYATQDAPAVAFVRSALQGEEWVVEVVSDGDRAIAKFEKGAPDVVLLDMALADMAGLDLLPKIKGIDPSVPVIVMGNTPAVDQAVVAMRRGASNYLFRPFDAGKVLEAVRLALQEVWQRREIERLKAETGQGLSKVRIDEILADLVVSGGSDLHLKVGRRPIYRVGGDLLESKFPVLDDDDVKGILLQVLTVDGFKVLERDFEYDTAYVLPDIARCRVNAYKRIGKYAAAFRMIPLVIPTVDAMGLPPVMKEICKVPQGLVLLTGPTGSGKSTSLAAMVDYLNEMESLHIITIEDPIEFVYTDRK